MMIDNDNGDEHDVCDEEHVSFCRYRKETCIANMLDIWCPEHCNNVGKLIPNTLGNVDFQGVLQLTGHSQLLHIYSTQLLHIYFS